MNPIVALPEPLLLGLHALVELSHDPERTFSTRHVAQAIGASEAHLSKILQRLARGGYVESIKGPGGGYRLALPPDQICALNIFELLGGPFTPQGCELSGCHGRPCLIGAMIDELTISLRDYLASKTLAHLLRYYDKAPAIHIGVSVSRQGKSRTKDRPSPDGGAPAKSS